MYILEPNERRKEKEIKREEEEKEYHVDDRALQKIIFLPCDLYMSPHVIRSEKDTYHVYSQKKKKKTRDSTIKK